MLKLDLRYLKFTFGILYVKFEFDMIFLYPIG